MRNEKSPKENSKSNKSPICHACGKPIKYVTGQNVNPWTQNSDIHWLHAKNHKFLRRIVFSILPLKISSILKSDSNPILEIPFLRNSIFYIFIIHYNDLILFNFY